MQATVADLLAHLEASTAPGLTGSGAVWRLDVTDERADHLQKALLAQAATFSSVFVHYDGGKPNQRSLRGAVQVAPGVWRLPQQATADDIADWLSMGNWQLYPHDKPLRKLQDLCRADAVSVASFVDEAGIPFIFDAFHDDTHWTIGLRIAGP